VLMMMMMTMMTMESRVEPDRRPQRDRSDPTSSNPRCTHRHRSRVLHYAWRHRPVERSSCLSRIPVVVAVEYTSYPRYRTSSSHSESVMHCRPSYRQSPNSRSRMRGMTTTMRLVLTVVEVVTEMDQSHYPSRGCSMKGMRSMMVWTDGVVERDPTPAALAAAARDGRHRPSTDLAICPRYTH